MSIRGHQETFEVSQDLMLLWPQGGKIADLASCDRAVRPVCAEREKPKETRCRETFKIGTTGLDQQYNLESFGMGVEITFSET